MIINFLNMTSSKKLTEQPLDSYSWKVLLGSLVLAWCLGTWLINNFLLKKIFP